VVHLNYLRELAPDIDIFGVNAYKGSDGFGELWQQVYRIYDKPVLLTEYGCDCYHPGQGVNEGEQAIYHEACWKDILYNRAGRGGYGNALGGIVFEWLDEWWKSNREASPFEHDTTHNVMFILPDGSISEEWFGLCGQGDGKHSPFLRELRRAYYLYKTMWTEWSLWEQKK
jgi:beta-glucuronidase